MLLTEQKIVELFSREYDRKIFEILSELDIGPFPGQAHKDAPVITRDLKVRHVKTLLLYTIDSVSPRDITLRTPEGRRFTVSADEFEKEYKLD